MIAGLVLAAGSGQRFGGAKQLAEFRGRPLLEHVLQETAKAPLDSVVVILGARAKSITDAVDLHGAEPVICADWQKGLGASLKAGLASLAAAEAITILLGDQPLVGATAIERVLSARREAAPAVRATYGGEPGHPVLVEHDLFSRLRDVDDNLGARAVLDTVRVRRIPCDDIAVPIDVDRPDDLRALEARAPT